MIQFKSRFLIQAASTSVINDAKKRYSKNPSFPQDDEGVKSLFEKLDDLVPKEAQSASAGKKIYEWLLKQLFNSNPPGFILAEDTHRVKPLMQNYWDAVSKNILRGDAANLDLYKNLEELDKALTPEEDSPEDHTGIYTEEEWAAINAGAKKLYDAEGYSLWKVAQTRDEWIEMHKKSQKGVYLAAYLLCSNDRNNVRWCVGYDKQNSLADNYIPDGDFYVLKKGERSIFAISSHKGRDLTIWNPQDTPVAEIGKFSGGGSKKSAPASMEAAAQKLGVSLDLGGISVIPRELIKPLIALRGKDETLDIIPEAQLTEQTGESLANVYKVLVSTDPVAFVRDLSQMYQSSTQYVLAHALMSYAVSNKVHMRFSKEAFEGMNKYSLNGYLEALAGTMNKDKRRLPKELDEALIPVVQDWVKR